MTTIYVPRLIESAEQAEALPVGTVAVEPETEDDRFPIMRDTWDGVDGWITEKKIYTLDYPIGWVALVPIEAEEETTGALTNRVGEVHWAEQTRFVTAWQEADQ